MRRRFGVVSLRAKFRRVIRFSLLFVISLFSTVLVSSSSLRISSCVSLSCLPCNLSLSILSLSLAVST